MTGGYSFAFNFLTPNLLFSFPLTFGVNVAACVYSLAVLFYRINAFFTVNFLKAWFIYGIVTVLLTHNSQISCLSFVPTKVCLPSAVAIPGVENAGVDQDGGTEDEKILRGVAAVCEEMRWYAEALANQRDSADGGYPN